MVQIREELADPAGGNGTDAWIDVALVTVAPKTKRKTALLAGLEQAKIELSEDLEARVLDEEASYIWRARPPAPKGLVLR